MILRKIIYHIIFSVQALNALAIVLLITGSPFVLYGWLFLDSFELISYGDFVLNWGVLIIWSVFTYVILDTISSLDYLHKNKLEVLHERKTKLEDKHIKLFIKWQKIDFKIGEVKNSIVCQEFEDALKQEDNQ